MRRTWYLFLSILSLSLLIFALILQQTGYQGVSFLPCPLCILQRLGYLGIALSCILAFTFKRLRKLFHGLAILAAGYGVGVAGYHVWLLSHPGESCGIDPLELWINHFQMVNAFPWLLKADGLCSAKLPAIMGLQVPEWSLIWFSFLLIVLLITNFRKPKA